MNKRAQTLKITFFCNTSREILFVNEFYNQDIQILEELGHTVSIATSFKEIDRNSDVIFIWWWTYALIPVLIGKLFGCKTIITGTFNYRCPELDRDFFKRPLTQRIVIKLAFKLANSNVLVSKQEFDAIKKDWNPKNIQYSPHIIDIDLYRPGNSPRHKNTIFTLSWMEEENIKRKCIIEIIEAAKIVVKESSDTLFIIAGRNGNASQRVSTIIKEYDLRENVKLVGEISSEKKIEYLQTCSIYLQPSRYEGFGVAIAEAMSCGSPVISSRAGEVENVVDKAGLLLDDNTPENIASSVKRLLKDDVLRKDLSSKARLRIESEFPKKRRLSDLNEIIQSITTV